MTDAAALKVFISYARDDGSAFAEELLFALEAAGFDPFLDRHDIAAGEPWEARLANLLQRADTVVYVITPAAVASRNCAWEIDKAVAQSKRILPVVAIDVHNDAIPESLARLNFVFFSRQPFGAALKELATALRADLGWIREHTHFAELAARWDESARPPDRLLRGGDVAAAKAWLAAWKSPSPEPTSLHREFINESDSAETARQGEERKRLEEMARSQAERERLIKRDARRTRIFAGVAGLLLAGALGALVGMFNARSAAEASEQRAATAQKLAADKEAEAEAAIAFAEEQKNEVSEAKRELAALQLQLAAAQQPATPSGPSFPGQPTFSTRAPAPPPAVRDAMRQARIASGWDIDVFYCEGAQAAANKARAEAVIAALQGEQGRQLAAAAPGAAGGPMALGRLRLKPLREEVNARAGYRIQRDVVRAEAAERREADALIAFLQGRQAASFTLEPSTMRTAFYLSAFLCKAD